MRRLLWLPALALVFSEAWAQENHIIQGVDASPLIELLNQQTSTVITPFKIFHYFNGWGEYSNTYPASDARGFRYVQYNAAQYFNNLGIPTNSAYGKALYAATDPISSRHYAHDPDWVLAEIQIPRGFRFINIHSSLHISFSREVQEVLAKLHCQSMSAFSDLFSPNHYGEFCAPGLREVLKQVHLDGIIYPFPSVFFPTCSGNLHDMAFVIMSSERLTPDMVRLYNANSKDDKPERKYLIGSLFRSAGSYPTTIQSNQHVTFGPGLGLEWQDLIGETTYPSSEMDSWIQNNLFGCSAAAQYTKPGVAP